jgi:4-hydroxy-tetrahydrodipicolinate reductase
MKIALVGHGKTGEYVQKLATSPPTLFDSKFTPTLEKLKGHDVIICFLPGPIFIDYIPLFIESHIPVVTGATGADFPADLNEKLTKNNLSWVHGHNFSISMVLLKQLLKNLGNAKGMLKNSRFEIEEIHHTKKLDAPSGTALMWEKWLGQQTKINSKREGDVVGIHKLHVQGDLEEINIEHIALNRGLFAEGALWAAEEVTTKKIQPGLHLFEELIENQFQLKR